MIASRRQHLDLDDAVACQLPLGEAQPGTRHLGADWGFGTARRRPNATNEVWRKG